jgi:2-keto-4-pentenoate hydratase
LELDELARRLARAEATREPISPISELRSGMSVDDAYTVQAAGRVLREVDGGRVVGHKIGLTSKAMQDALGVDQPDYGYLLASQIHASGSRVSAERFIAPRVEGEIAFRLGAPLTGARVAAESVLAATTSVAPALEVIDSRIRDWKVTIVDTIADNAAGGAAILGDWVRLDELGVDLAALTLRMQVDGEVVEGRGDAVLGHPAESVAWLARALHAQGEALRADEIVLSGALARALPIKPGSSAEASLGSLGTVKAAF